MVQRNFLCCQKTPDKHHELLAKHKPTALELMLPTKLSMDKEKPKIYGTQKCNIDDESDAFLQEDEIGVNDDPHCHDGDCCSDVYPRVCLLARRWLAVPASSTSSERVCLSGNMAEKR